MTTSLVTFCFSYKMLSLTLLSQRYIAYNSYLCSYMKYLYAECLLFLPYFNLRCITNHLCICAYVSSAVLLLAQFWGGLKLEGWLQSCSSISKSTSAAIPPSEHLSQCLITDFFLCLPFPSWGSSQEDHCKILSAMSEQHRIYSNRSAKTQKSLGYHIDTWSIQKIAEKYKKFTKLDTPGL